MRQLCCVFCSEDINTWSLPSRTKWSAYNELWKKLRLMLRKKKSCKRSRSRSKLQFDPISKHWWELIEQNPERARISLWIALNLQLASGDRLSTCFSKRDEMNEIIQRTFNALGKRDCASVAWKFKKFSPILRQDSTCAPISHQITLPYFDHKKS